MPKVKIIHVLLGKANPERMNGVNVVVHSLATYQSSLGAEVEVWGITPTPEHSSIERNYSILLFKASSWLLDPALKKELARQPEHTVFHLHAGFISLFYPLAMLLNKYSYKYVLTPHGNYMEGAMHKNYFFKRIYFSFFERRILEKSLFVHCLGEGEVVNVRKLLKRDPTVQIIPNGQDSKVFNFSYRPILKEEGPVFGFCGRLAKYQKGLDLLLSGFKEYKKERMGRGVLWLVGDGDFRKKIERFITENELENSVKLWGSRYGDEKLNLMANMDAFYHPSRNEGLPMAVLEASALGVPLVVSEFTNMTGYVSAYEAGICLTENTTQHIANSMKQIDDLMREGKLESFGENAIRMAKENFDWNVIAKKLLEAYEISE